MRRVPLGVEDFRFNRENDLVYIDKLDMIRECLERAGSRVLVVAWPRRFGKSLNLSMLREMSGHLHRYHREKVVILVDGYDVPVCTGYLQGAAPSSGGCRGD
jgi:hypothetical protein